LTVRPGITSLASIKFRNEEPLLAGATDLDTLYFEIMQQKLRLELQYVDERSFFLDLWIIWRTIVSLFDQTIPDASGKGFSTNE
jgi:lipopolysaccharide/colanic/teichoic acid biosynthesis glycosyltransferase